ESPERSNGVEKHFPDNGGLFVNLTKNKWYSHGNKVGGDALDLVCFVLGCDKSAGMAWLRSHGHIEQRSNASRVVETYTYGEGRGCYYVARHDPKRFTQWREIDGERVNGTAASRYERRYPDGPWYRIKDQWRPPRPGEREFPAVTPVLYRQAELDD